MFSLLLGQKVLSVLSGLARFLTKTLSLEGTLVQQTYSLDLYVEAQRFRESL